MASSPCSCEFGFQSRRCVCFQAGKACTAGCRCGCQQCNNPLNGVVGLERLTNCARSHIVKVKLLSQKELKETYRLACDCRTAMPLRTLMEGYLCAVCQIFSFYSFCLKTSVQETQIAHCSQCGHCTQRINVHCSECRN